jgi:hypothetical protein
MRGRQSTLSAHGVAQLLKVALPQVEVAAFKHLGYMGLITLPELINPVIEQFLQKQAMA